MIEKTDVQKPPRERDSRKDGPRQLLPPRGLWLGLLAVVAVVVALSLPVQGGGVAGSGSAGQNEVPQAFTEAGCDRCHSVQSAGIEAKMSGKLAGPVLDEPRPERSREWYQEYLRKAEALNGKTHPVSWKGDDQQLEAVAAWLVALQKKNSPGAAG